MRFEDVVASGEVVFVEGTFMEVVDFCHRQDAIPLT